ncbi:MAG: type I DNA topoisomerase [Candidatus Schekmanbacteria bacterium]|nr:MAG: type I DNA topoisomerase [Candidatus Schekmanbacteria bacterium]
MASKLIIVESPAKAKTINKIVGKDFKVKATIGHIKDLPKSKLGINIENGFEPTYTTIKGKSKTIKELKEAAEKVKEVYIASDPDREGEMIAWHVASVIDHKKKNGKKIYRVLFNEITRDAVKKAIESPGEIDENKVEAQQARRVLDRLVGYKISPLLWKKVMYGLSAGRVQSVALRLICEREEEIKNFVSEEYWTIDAINEAAQPPTFKSRLIEFKNEKIKIANKEESDRIVDEVGKEKFTVKKITKKERKRYPLPPFITSTLQQEAYRHYGFSAKKTMVIAQQLYEGLDIGEEGTTGLITYMRTDSVRVADEAKRAAREFIKEKYGDKYFPKQSPEYASGKSAQDAHEAIRPTSPAREPEAIAQYLSKDQMKIYSLIWKRFISSQMTPSIIDSTSVDISAGDYLFRANGNVLKFDGFRKVYTEKKDEESSENGNGNDKDVYLPEMREGEEVKLLELIPKQHFTEPPPRYTEATLVKQLEKLGIGRPSTYATIMDTIQNRNYTIKEKKKFVPTDLGILINKLLVKSFPDIINTDFTASMENRLDEIEEGKSDRLIVLNEFYEKFEKDLAAAQKEMEVEEEITEIKCDKCGNMMVKKWGRNGPFLACPAYPECKNTKDFTTDEEGNIKIIDDIETDEICEKCGRKMVVKQGRFGRFLACTGYPECKNTKKIAVENGEVVKKSKSKLLDEKCPKCGKPLAQRSGRYGEFISCSGYPKCRFIKPQETGVKCLKEGCDGNIVQKKSRKGIFYGCDRYPDCDFAIWDKPINKECPECGSHYLLQKKKRKNQPSVIVCPNEECGYEEADSFEEG